MKTKARIGDDDDGDEPYAEGPVVCAGTKLRRRPCCCWCCERADEVTLVKLLAIRL
jgi:hypothetical protein